MPTPKVLPEPSPAAEAPRPQADAAERLGILLIDLVPKAGFEATLRDLLFERRFGLTALAPGDDAGQLEVPRSCDDPALDVAIVTTAPALYEVTSRLLRELRRRAPRLPLLLVADGGGADDLMDLLGPGVDDYVVPPLSRAQLLPRLLRLVERRRRSSKDEGVEVVEVTGMIGRSAAFHRLVEQLRELAECDATVLIEGETGTGKELASRALHDLSRRAEQPFCPVNCGALPRELVENELFGHRRAAFTGASVAQVGLIAGAEGGTLLLDEVDCLPDSAQAALLRFAENREYRPLGSNRVKKANVRLLASTNTDLEGAVGRGRFRQDLYYRLDILRLELPPLRRRRDDIPVLAQHFLTRFAERFSAATQRLSAEALAVLLEYDWPGNVRELEHVVERAVALGRKRRVLEPSHVRIAGRRPVAPACESFQRAKNRVVESFERSYLTASLTAHGGNVSRAAKSAGKHRRAFWELLRKHGIKADDFRQAPAETPQGTTSGRVAELEQPAAGTPKL